MCPFPSLHENASNAFSLQGGKGFRYELPMKDSLFCAAQITSAHGIRGHVKAKCFLDNSQDLLRYSPLLNESGEAPYQISKILSQTKDMLILQLEGVTTRTQAETLKGHKLMVERSRLPDLEEDLFYHTDLVGLKVTTKDGTEIGTIRALHNFGAGDILDVETLTHKSEFLPFTHAMVPEIDLKQGLIKLSPEGALALGGEAHDA